MLQWCQEWVMKVKSPKKYKVQMNCNILSIFSLCIQSILWYFFFGCLCISCVSCRWPVVMWPLPNLAIKVALLVCSVFTLPTTHGRSCDKVLKFCLCSCNCLYLCKWCIRVKTVKKQLVVLWPMYITPCQTSSDLHALQKYFPTWIWCVISAWKVGMS